MLEIHSKYSDLIKDLFQNDQEFISALDKACASAVNFRVSPKLPCKSPELVRSHSLSLSLFFSFSFTVS